MIMEPIKKIAIGKSGLVLPRNCLYLFKRFTKERTENDPKCERTLRESCLMTAPT
jgi:hypothetical protein